MRIILEDPAIMSRADAKARGLLTYYTAHRCKHGHIAERRVSDSHCMRCMEDPELQQRTRQTKRLWQARNKELLRKSKREYQRRNRDRINARNRAYRVDNLEEVRAKDRINHKKYREHARLRARARHARKRNARGKHTLRQIHEMHTKQRYKCASCFCCIKDKYHVDHIIPLKRGGSNDIGNIQLLCPLCNTRKAAKDPVQWAHENGRLL